MIRKFAPFIFAVAAVAIMIAPAIGVGYASSPVSYTAVTTNSSSSITADYFTAGIYESDGVTVPSKLIDKSLYYVSVTGGYSVTGRNVGKSGLCVAINTTNHTMRGESYSITGSWSISSGSAPSAGSKIICYVGNASNYLNNDSFDMFSSNDQAHPSTSLNYDGSTKNIYFDIDFTYSSVPANLNLVLSFTVTDNNGAAVSCANNTFTFESGTSTDVLQSELDSANSGNTTISGMEFESDNTGTPNGVYIQVDGSSSHSIANGDQGLISQAIAFSLYIPQGTKMYIYVTITVGLVASQSTVTLTVTGDGAPTGSTTMNGQGTFGRTTSYYVGCSGAALASNLNTQGSLTPIVCNSGQLTMNFTGSEGQWSNVSAKLVPVE